MPITFFHRTMRKMSFMHPFDAFKGIDVLQDPVINKGTAFTQHERESLNIVGLLPDGVDTLEIQKQRVLTHLAKKTTDLERYIYLIALLDRNETLFYAVIMSDPLRFIPILYDPTVGEACLEFNDIYRRPRGIYISWPHKGRIASILRNWPVKEIRFICVSTGERILGLGDLGANGMGIPIGKLQLYTACASIPPDCLLPILLDAGTNNEKLLKDSLYLGYKQKRPDEVLMDEFVDEFICATQEVFPNCCVHFEDWKGTDAIKYLAKYSQRLCCYNDDIQGTASIVLSGLFTAANLKKEKISDQKVFFLGAGSAGIGIAHMLVLAMKREGLQDQEAQGRIAFFDVNGMLDVSRKDLLPAQRIYAKNLPATQDLSAAISAFKPTVLIGVSTQGCAFNEHVIELMAKFNERPIIFALSNPTEKAECTAEQAYQWTEGKAIFAAGVQFPSVHFKDKVFYPGQANNFYIFPAVSLAIYATRPKYVSDALFIEAAYAISMQMNAADLDKGMLFPKQDHIQDIEIAIAIHVAKFIFKSGLATVQEPQDISAWIQKMLYKAEYIYLNTGSR